MSVFGHQVNVPEAVIGRRIAKFSFDQLCSEALGAADYIHLAETFRIVFISDIPILNLDYKNEKKIREKYDFYYKEGESSELSLNLIET